MIAVRKASTQPAARPGRSQDDRGLIARTLQGRAALLVALVLLALAASPAFAAPDDEDEGDAVDPLRYRVRVVKLTPEQPAMIHWRYGGEGLGGDPVGGVVTRERPAPPAALGEDDTGFDLQAALDGPPKDRVIVKGDTWDTHYLNPGVWSKSRPLLELRSTYMTFMITGLKTERALKNSQIEFEISFEGKVIKNFTVNGPDGPTFGVVIPRRELENGKPTAEFIKKIGGLYEYIVNKQDLLKSEPWFSWPTPVLTGVITDCGGYGENQGYGTRTSDKDTYLAEVETMRLMGFNGFRNSEGFMQEMVRNREGIGAGFARAKETHAGGGFGIPMIDIADGRAPTRQPNDGCPYLPAHREQLPITRQANFDHFLETAIATGAEDVWGVTIDEIGNVFGRSNEGGNHPGSCKHCSEAFREMVRADGRTLEDFGATTWDDIRPVSGYWAIDYYTSHAIISKQLDEAQKAMEASTRKPLGLESTDELTEFTLDDKPKVDYTQLMVDLRERKKQLEWSSKILFVPEEERKTSVSEEGWHLLEYYNRRFIEVTSGRMFEDWKRYVHAYNQKKKDAIARGDLDSPEAKQPNLYVFGLRQPRFTWGGGSLGTFEYYRYADSAFVYETSNRDARIYQWDSYMNDVGRAMHAETGLDFGVYVKPHRGAPTQRALSAATRDSKLLYWYTYGPEWAKGDTFGGSDRIRADVAFANRLVAATEDVLVGGHWTLEPEVAIVRPRTAEFFSGTESWENGKWVYMALAHAQIPVVALDEMLIEKADLSKYKVIVISGSHIRHKSAERLKKWVADGGTLYTCGFGMAKDEAGRPLRILHEVFGVTDRQSEFPQWGSTRRYGATRIAGITQDSPPPADAKLTGTSLLEGSFDPLVGCEVMTPASGAQVLATNASGKPVALMNQYGKGRAYLIGTFAGLEYATQAMERQPYDAAKRTWVAAPVLAAGVKPIVDVSDPLVEGVLVQNDKSHKQALALMNWNYLPERREITDVTVKFRGFDDRTKVRSTVLQQELKTTISGEWMTVSLPRLEDADVLIVE